MITYNWINMHRLLKCLCTEVDFFLKQYPESTLPKRERFEFYKDKWYVESKKTYYLDFETAIWNIEDKICESECYNKLITEINHSEKLHNLMNGFAHTNTSSSKINTKEIIFRFLGEYYRRQQLKSVKNLFDDFYKEFESALLRKKFKCNVIVHLQGLISDIDQFEFEGIVLKKMSLENLNHLFGEEAFYQDSDYTRYKNCFVSECSYYRQVTTTEKKEMTSDFPEKIILDKIDKIISILRLFKPGYIAIDRYLVIPQAWELDFFGHGSIHSTDTIIQKEYYLKNSELNQLRIFYNNYLHNRNIKSNKFKNSFHWLGNSSLRQKSIDRFLDYIIVLEALYLTDRQELSFKLPLRVAYYLGRDYKERSFYFNILRKAYSLRSNLVHNGKPLPNEVSINTKRYRCDKFIEKIENIVFKSVAQIINNIDHRFPTKNEIWDKLILEGKSYFANINA